MVSAGSQPRRPESRPATVAAPARSESKARRNRAGERKILVIDVGGSNVKLLASGLKTPIKIVSGPTMTARRMVQLVQRATRGWEFDVISIGFPGPVRHHRPLAEPHNLGPGWRRFNFRKALGRPFRMVNDAAMQALGSYRGGTMLFLGLGTGLGSALVVDGRLVPFELGHLPYKNGDTYEDYVGLRGLLRFGKKRWRQHVCDIVSLLTEALQAEDVVLGGGNVKKLKTMPAGCRPGNNHNAFRGGFLLWKDESAPRPERRAPRRRSSRVTP